MSSKNVLAMILRNLRSMNTSLAIISESLSGLLEIINAMPTSEDLSEVTAEAEAQQTEILALQAQIQTILDSIKTKKK